MLTKETQEMMFDVCEAAVERLRKIRETHSIDSPFTIDALNMVIKRAKEELAEKSE